MLQEACFGFEVEENGGSNARRPVSMTQHSFNTPGLLRDHEVEATNRDVEGREDRTLSKLEPNLTRRQMRALRGLCETGIYKYSCVPMD